MKGVGLPGSPTPMLPNIKQIVSFQAVPDFLSTAFPRVSPGHEVVHALRIIRRAIWKDCCYGGACLPISYGVEAAGLLHVCMYIDIPL